jgi:hypothetical protein
VYPGHRRTVRGSPDAGRLNPPRSTGSAGRRGRARNPDLDEPGAVHLLREAQRRAGVRAGRRIDPDDPVAVGDDQLGALDDAHPGHAHRRRQLRLRPDRDRRAGQRVRHPYGVVAARGDQGGQRPRQRRPDSASYRVTRPSSVATSSCVGRRRGAARVVRGSARCPGRPRPGRVPGRPALAPRNEDDADGQTDRIRRRSAARAGARHEHPRRHGEGDSRPEGPQRRLVQVLGRADHHQ